MVIVTSDIQYKIIDAYFRVLQEKPEVEKITLNMVASKVEMRRESIYRYHFKNVKEIQERIRYLIDGEFEKKVRKFLLAENPDLNNFITKKMLPHLYEKRDWHLIKQE